MERCVSVSDIVLAAGDSDGATPQNGTAYIVGAGSGGLFVIVRRLGSFSFLDFLRGGGSGLRSR